MKNPIEIDPRCKLDKYINDGAVICQKIKNIYYSEIAWKDCYRQVADIFTEIKRRVRQNYPEGSIDNPVIESLSRYSERDLKVIYEEDL